MSFISKATITDIAHSVNVSNLSDAAAKALAPDVEYRLREVIQEALKFARNAKRQKLTTDDINLALRLKNIEPLYGFSGNRDPSKYVRAAGHPDVFFLQDKELDLEQFITADLPKPPLEVGVCPHWLVINGVQPSVRENMPVEKPAAKRARLSQHKDVSDAGPKNKQAAANKDANLPKSTPVVPPVGSSAALAAAAGLHAGPPVEVVMPVKHVLSQELQVYYSKVAALLRGEDVTLGAYQPAAITVATAVAQTAESDTTKAPTADTEQQQFARRAILESLATDPGLPALIPYLVQLIVEEVERRLASVSRLKLLLAAARSLLCNQYCEMGPYLHKLMPRLATCVLAKRIGHKEPGSDHWSLRQEAAQLVAGVIHKYAKDYPSLQSGFVRTLTKVMEDGTMPLTSHYGAIVGITSLGSKVVGVLLLPNLLKYQMRIGPALQDGKHPDRQYQAWRCYGALLDGTCSCLHARIVSMLSEKLPYRLLAVLASSHPHRKGMPPEDEEEREEEENNTDTVLSKAQSTMLDGRKSLDSARTPPGGAVVQTAGEGGVTGKNEAGNETLQSATDGPQQQQQATHGAAANGSQRVEAHNEPNLGNGVQAPQEEPGRGPDNVATPIPSLAQEYLDTGLIGFHTRLTPDKCPILLGPHRPAKLDAGRFLVFIQSQAAQLLGNSSLTRKYETLHRYSCAACKTTMKQAPTEGGEVAPGITFNTPLERFMHEAAVLFKVVVDSLPELGMAAQVVRGTRGGQPSTWNVIVVDGAPEGPSWGVLDPGLPGALQVLDTGPGAVYKSKRRGEQEFQPLSVTAIMDDFHRKPATASHDAEGTAAPSQVNGTHTAAPNAAAAPPSAINPSQDPTGNPNVDQHQSAAPMDSEPQNQQDTATRQHDTTTTTHPDPLQGGTVTPSLQVGATAIGDKQDGPAGVTAIPTQDASGHAINQDGKSEKQAVPEGEIRGTDGGEGPSAAATVAPGGDAMDVDVEDGNGAEKNASCNGIAGPTTGDSAGVELKNQSLEDGPAAMTPKAGKPSVLNTISGVKQQQGRGTLVKQQSLVKGQVRKERSVKEVLADAYKEDADLDEQLGALSIMFGEAFVGRLPLHAHLASMMW